MPEIFESRSKEDLRDSCKIEMHNSETPWDEIKKTILAIETEAGGEQMALEDKEVQGAFENSEAVVICVNNEYSQ
ncbi:hypothetical protein KW786_03860, partial [Candidatus Parcubacteria bacterium]|nr:hypothetical protein [Candidatus Parcubacteria bacterium]